MNLRYGLACLSLLALLIACSEQAATPSGASTKTLPGQAEETPLPELRLPNLAGEPQSLRAETDKATVINFWATWCTPCLREIPHLVALNDQLQPQGLRVIGVALSSGKAAEIRSFAKEHGMDYPLLTAERQWARKHLRVFGLPVTLIVDRQGTIRRRLIGPHTEEQFEAATRPYL